MQLRNTVVTVTLAAGLLLVTIAGSAALVRAEEPSVGIDANPAGNTATSLGEIDTCIEVSTGDIFDIDFFARDVEDLLAWSIELETDGTIVSVVDRSVEFLLNDLDGSNVFDLSGTTPDDDGIYALGAVDTADPLSPESGSGVLARVTLQALAPGVSPLRLAERDVDDDGTLDRGVLLRNVDNESITDDDGDTFFDGPIANAQVAVDTACDSADLVRSEDDGDGPWLIIGVAIGAVAILTVGGFVFIRRRSAGSS